MDRIELTQGNELAGIPLRRISTFKTLDLLNNVVEIMWEICVEGNQFPVYVVKAPDSSDIWLCAPEEYGDVGF